MAASVLVATRSALATQLAAIAGLSAFDVGYQWRVQSESRKRVWTRNGRVSVGPASMRSGRTYRDEEGHFEVAVLVEGPGDSMETVSTAAIAAGQLIEEWIGDNRSGAVLAVTGLQWLVVEGEGSLKEGFTDNAHLAEWTIPVRYQARIT